ncbi:MAG: hypothetical protein HYT16_00810 [DPANN group archaeon]|nr:hypothetical protein [DPANN group archaeon]
MVNELSRKILHATGILAVLPVLYLTGQQLMQILAFLTAGVLVLHWYIDFRHVRRKRINDSIRGVLETFGEKYDEVSEKELEKLEEDFFQSIKKEFLRDGEQAIFLPALYFFSSLLFTLIFFGKSYLFFGIIALAMGDSAAALAGKYFGKHKIFWNRDKSFEGMAGFAVVTFAVTLIFLAIFPQFALFSAWELAAFVGIAGAAIESLPILDDNFSIPLLTAIALSLAVRFF